MKAEDYKSQRDWYVPIVADAEAGFGGALNCFELMKVNLIGNFTKNLKKIFLKAYIEAGASGVHFEDQLGSEKKCGHMGGKVLIPTAQHIRHLNAARLAADVCGVPTIIVARTDAESARLITRYFKGKKKVPKNFQKKFQVTLMNVTIHSLTNTREERLKDFIVYVKTMPYNRVLNVLKAMLLIVI